MTITEHDHPIVTETELQQTGWQPPIDTPPAATTVEEIQTEFVGPMPELVDTPSPTAAQIQRAAIRAQQAPALGAWTSMLVEQADAIGWCAPWGMEARVSQTVADYEASIAPLAAASEAHQAAGVGDSLALSRATEQLKQALDVVKAQKAKNLQLFREANILLAAQAVAAREGMQDHMQYQIQQELSPIAERAAGPLADTLLRQSAIAAGKEAWHQTHPGERWAPHQAPHQKLFSRL